MFVRKKQSLGYSYLQENKLKRDQKKIEAIQRKNEEKIKKQLDSMHEQELASMTASGQNQMKSSEDRRLQRELKEMRLIDIEFDVFKKRDLLPPRIDYDRKEAAQEPLFVTKPIGPYEPKLPQDQHGASFEPNPLLAVKPFPEKASTHQTTD